MSDWKVIVPEATTNYVLNPSAEIAGNFAAEAGTTVTRSSTYNRYGLYSFRVQCNANNEGIQITTVSLANAIHTATVRVRGTLPTAWDWSMNNVNWHTPTLVEALDSNWSLYEVEFPAAQCNGQTTFRIHQNGAGSGDFYLDGIQIEQKSYWTTYVDGDQQGCEWNGAEHSSTSIRSASSRAGGRQRDLEDDYHFDIGGMTGLGASPQSVIMDEYARLPGGELNTIKIHPRPFALTGVVCGSGSADLHDKTFDLESILLPDAYPQDDYGYQPVRLRYTGSTIHKEIAAHYEGGMEGNLRADTCYWQRMGIRFLAGDPYFRDYGGSGASGAGEALLLDTNDTITTRMVTARLKSTGQWDDMGPPSGPNVVFVAVVKIGPEDGKIYFGGDFQNFNGIAAADYIAVYDPQTDSYSALGGGLNNIVRDIAFDADGILYAAGDFTNAGGDANADYIAQIDPMAGAPAWSNVGGGPGAGVVTEIQCLLFDAAGNLYIGGTFTNWSGIANADYIAMWNGAAWNALGTGMDAVVYDLALDLDGTTIYAGGVFTTAGGVATGDVAAWDGSSWSALISGSDAIIYVVTVGNDNTLYAGGTFSNIGGIAAEKIAGWNGTAWFTLGSGVDTGISVYTIEVGPDDVLYAAGNFSEIGGIPADKFAKWNGSSWAHLDINLPATQVESIAFGNSDPVIQQNYDIWLGYFNPVGNTYCAGLVTVTNNGTTVFPILIAERSGGTSATLKTIRNETTGKELLFNYALLDGERLTIDLRPTQQSIVSSMFGSAPNAILAGSDFGDFVLRTGDNDITCFVDVAGAPTVTAWIEWRTAYRGL